MKVYVAFFLLILWSVLVSKNLTTESVLQDSPGKFRTVLIDPPWRFANSIAGVPEQKRRAEGVIFR